MTTRRDLAEQVATDAGGLVTRLDRRSWPGQSLAEGAGGVALLDIELAVAGHAHWDRVRARLTEATAEGVSVGSNASLYFGAPAIEFVLHAAAPYELDSHARTLPLIQAATDRIVRNRLEAATARRLRGDRPSLREFDLIRGLTGLGTMLLTRGVGTPLLGDVLDHLVGLTEPVQCQEEILPGWWVDAGPDGRALQGYDGGHSNNGMAHGIAGLLALLALAMRRGAVVDGHADAIGRIVAWLDRWRPGVAPYWVTRAELHGSRIGAVPERPSWCYGAVGLARAQQLAALAVGDQVRRTAAESLAIMALADSSALSLICDASLCHGWAGLLRCTAAIAADSQNPEQFTYLIRDLAGRLTAAAPALERSGLLEGRAGAALALLTLDAPPATDWDRALLIN
jgi:hypothetical protein